VSMVKAPWLSAITIDPNRFPKFEYELIRKMTQDEYAEFKKADDRLSRFSEDQEKVGLLRDTYEDYKATVESHARQLEARKHPISVAEVAAQNKRAYNQINARVRSVLSEITTFLNYTEGFLKREYGKDSDQFKTFKTRTNIEYDASASYRFIYQLRNYAIHYDVPINAMHSEDGERDPSTGVVRKIVRVEVDRDRLLNSGYDWRKVRPDLENFPPRFSLDAHLDHTIRAIGIINAAATVAMLPDTKQSARYIHQLIQPVLPRLSGKEGTPIIVLWEPPDNASVGETVQMNYSTKAIPADLAEHVLSLPEPKIMAVAVDDLAKQLRAATV
jgi:hypothetical protein